MLFVAANFAEAPDDVKRGPTGDGSTPLWFEHSLFEPQAP
jgi:hypothetical protein